MDRVRDIATDAHKGKDDQIRELEDRVETLEKEAVIADLNVFKDGITVDPILP